MWLLLIVHLTLAAQKMAADTCVDHATATGPMSDLRGSKSIQSLTDFVIESVAPFQLASSASIKYNAIVVSLTSAISNALMRYIQAKCMQQYV